MNATEILLYNYRTALDQAQRYLALALGSAVGVWLLRGPSSVTKVMVPGIFVEVDWQTARILLLGFHIVVAFLATYTVETGLRLAAGLKSHPQIANAMDDYPNIPCSPWPLVRLAVPILCMVLVGWAQFASSTAFGVGNVVAIVLLFSAHFTLITYLWRHPNGEISPLHLKK